MWTCPQCPDCGHMLTLEQKGWRNEWECKNPKCPSNANLSIKKEEKE